MSAPSRSNAVLRGVALRGEALLQRVLRAQAVAAARLRARRSPTDVAAFRGRSCHCPSGLQPHFVHSEALREACDFVVDFGTNVEALGRPRTPVGALAPAAGQLPAGARVHVKSDLLDEFVVKVLPAIARPIVLVTGDSDAAVVVRHRALLEHPQVAHWFAQNCDSPEPHSRLTAIPIGFDNPVYTKLEKRLGFLVTMLLRRTPVDWTVSRNDIGDQARFVRVRAGIPPPAMRPARALCTFHQNQKIIRADVSNLPDRAEAYRLLRDNPVCEFVPHRLPQAECWRRHGEFAFEVSPRGNGLDCFRTWEALALGTIPIVKRSPLDRLYAEEHLPVVSVISWTEITAGNLERWRQELQPRFGPELERKLSADYWIAKIRNESQRAGTPQ